MTTKRFRKSIFIFRRDLRLHDNTGLINALNSSEHLYCMYFLDENMLKSKSEYSSIELSVRPIDLYRRRQKRDHLILFLKTSLIDLQKQFVNLGKHDYKSKTESKSDQKTHLFDSRMGSKSSKNNFFYLVILLPCLMKFFVPTMKLKRSF